MEPLTKIFKIFLLILLLSSVCYSTYPKKRILDNSEHQDKNAPPSSSKIIKSDQPSTSGVQNSNSILKKKYETYVVNGKVKYVCTDCSYETSVQKTASGHWYDKHDSRIFKCAECDYESTRQNNVKRHQRIVHQGLKPFRCDYCEYKGSSKPLLTQHVNAHHLNLREYKCTQCEYETAVKHHLKQHLKFTHLDTK